MVVKTLEAALAIVIILSSIVFLFPVSISQQKPYSAYSCLSQMDMNGILRHYASEPSVIELGLRGCIPVSFDYEVKVCQSSNCGTSTPLGKSVFLTSYMISGEDPALVNVWVWSK
jgi:hypothetical protein